MERTLTFEQPLKQVTLKLPDLDVVEEVQGIWATITLTEAQVDDVLLVLQRQKHTWTEEDEEAQEAARELGRWFMLPLREEKEDENENL